MQAISMIRFAANEPAKKPEKKADNGKPELIKTPQVGERSAKGNRIVTTVNISNLNGALPVWAKADILNANADIRLRAAQALSDGGGGINAIKLLCEEARRSKKK